MSGRGTIPVIRRVATAFLLILAPHISYPQSGRIDYNRQELFLSGANLAWVAFAHDIGPGLTSYDSFADAMLRMHDHGGNALRWWLHTDGSQTPAYNDTGLVIGPGEGTIEDMKEVLDLAWEREIGVDLCLWSFDMLRSSNSPTVLERNRKLLTDTSYTRSYIDRCLIPMIDSLKGHPAIIAWEIFNEPEGMSDEFGWESIGHVPMSAIQRFINLCAGAIHRTDSTALVTNGAWCFYSLTDMPLASLAKTESGFATLTPEAQRQIALRFNEKYRMMLPADAIIRHMQEAAARSGYNYYTDGRLIATGGDSLGTLDFYSVHYYDWAPTAVSPFHHTVSSWGLDKPIVVGEFAMQDTYGVPPSDLYETLYQGGYAGALAWSWTDTSLSSRADMLSAMNLMWEQHRADVDVNGIAGDWPLVMMTSPVDNAEVPDTSAIPLVAEASDPDGSVTLVEFFANDSIFIGQTATPTPNGHTFATTWTNIPSGYYTLKAIATDNDGHNRTSDLVHIKIGVPAVTRLEAEDAAVVGQELGTRSDPSASNGAYVEMRSSVGTITWNLADVPADGNCEIAFGYRLSFDTPKDQNLNVNGSPLGEIVFGGPMNVWLEKKLPVSFVQGANTVTITSTWGWMDLDYLAVPRGIVSSVGTSGEPPRRFSLDQNYPNPFNPSTTIRYTLPKAGQARLEVFDLLGRRVAVLVDAVQGAGTHIATFDGRAQPSGMYVYRLEAGGGSRQNRMLLLK